MIHKLCFTIVGIYASNGLKICKMRTFGYIKSCISSYDVYLENKF